MAKWRVTIPTWCTEIEAEDEGDALILADCEFNFMSEARAEELEDESKEK